jgi:basic membrane protein A and related proteins
MQRQHRARLALVGAAALIAAGVAAYGVGAMRTAKVGVIGIAAPEKANDYGWNQQGVAGARSAAKAVGAKLLVSDGIGYTNTDSVLRQLAQHGANLVIAHAGGYATVARRLAQQLKVPMLSTGLPGKGIRGVYADYETKQETVAYLAGVMAASMTKTGTLGSLRSAANVPDFLRLAGGFVAGARSVNPKIKIIDTEIGAASFSDVAGGKRLAQSEIAQGADILIGTGDGSSFGYLQAVETAKPPAPATKVWFIDFLGNKTPIDKKHVLLSSVVENFSQIFTQAAKDVENGTFGTHDYVLTPANGISLLKTPYIPASVWAKVQKARTQILAGKIHVPVTNTEAQLHALLNK